MDPYMNPIGYVVFKYVPVFIMSVFGIVMGVILKNTNSPYLEKILKPIMLLCFIFAMGLFLWLGVRQWP